MAETKTTSGVRQASGSATRITRRTLMAGAAVAAAAATQAPRAMAAASSATPGSGSCAEAGTVWWSELISADPEQVRDFYAKVVGWNVKVVALEDTARPANAGEPEYTLFLANGRESAGLMKVERGDSIEAGWFTYIQVDNVDVAVLAAASSGGKVLKLPFDVADTGRIAIVEDPQGAVFGLITPVRGSGC